MSNFTMVRLSHFWILNRFELINFCLRIQTIRLHKISVTILYIFNKTKSLINVYLNSQIITQFIKKAYLSIIKFLSYSTSIKNLFSEFYTLTT